MPFVENDTSELPYHIHVFFIHSSLNFLAHGCILSAKFEEVRPVNKIACCSSVCRSQAVLVSLLTSVDVIVSKDETSTINRDPDVLVTIYGGSFQCHERSFAL